MPNPSKNQSRDSGGHRRDLGGGHGVLLVSGSQVSGSGPRVSGTSDSRGVGLGSRIFHSY